MKTEQTNKRPIKTSGYSSARLHAKRDRKHCEAIARAENLAPFKRLTLQQQIDWFYDDGPGHGREITRRQKQVAIDLGLWPTVKSSVKNR